jgi:hypothetical protein
VARWRIRTTRAELAALVRVPFDPVALGRPRSEGLSLA